VASSGVADAADRWPDTDELPHAVAIKSTAAATAERHGNLVPRYSWWSRGLYWVCYIRATPIQQRCHASSGCDVDFEFKKLVGGPGFEPGASRSRTVEIVVQKRAKRSDPVRNVSRGPWSRPDSGQSSGGLLQKLLHDRLLSGVLCVWAHVNGLARDFGVSVESIKRQLLDGLLHHCSSDVSNPSSSLPARPVAGGYEGP